MRTRILTSLIAIALLGMALGCGGTPDRSRKGKGKVAKGPISYRAPPKGNGGPRFVDGREFEAASAHQARAIEQHRQAFVETDPRDREALLAAALASCREAQREYEAAMHRYPYHQRDSIEFQMKAVHEIMLEIERDRR